LFWFIFNKASQQKQIIIVTNQKIMIDKM